MNKKLFGAAAALMLLVGCGAPTSTTTGDNQPAAPQTSPAAHPPSSADPTPSESASQEAPDSDADYVVTIDGSHQTKDYEGKAALVVDYTFTNHSDDATMFMTAVSAKAFQGGVELEIAIPLKDKKYDAANATKQIKPGASIKAQLAYALADKSEVSVEVTNLFSLDDTPIATKTISVK